MLNNDKFSINADMLKIKADKSNPENLPNTHEPMVQPSRTQAGHSRTRSKNDNPILLFSGGMDSYIAWHYLGKPKCVYFKIGHRYMRNELEQVAKLRKMDKELEIEFDDTFNLTWWEEPDAYIPARNLLLITGATRYSDNIVLVVQKGETNLGDRSKEFFSNTEKTLSEMLGRKITIETPFWEMTKVDMVKWYLEQGLPAENLLVTTSCYTGREIACGKCSACVRRAIALELNGLSEPYEVDPKMTSLAREYLDKARQEFYIDERNEQILRWLGEWEE
jgi:7-cyano-7-deazaguanine synthase